MKRTRNINAEQHHLISSGDWSGCEALIEAFEVAWQQGEKPCIRDFLRGDGATRQTLLVELVHTDLEFRLKSGEMARVESYLATFPELADDRQTTADLISAEYEFRRRYSEVSVSEYRDRFPDYASLLNLDDTLSDTVSPRSLTSLIAADPTVWPNVPGFQILAELGRGGMGIVYQAREESLGRNVALKFLPAEYATDPERLERFLREARTASALNHPHICTIHGLGEHEGRPFIVMELIEGSTLKTAIQRSPGVDDVLRIIGQAAEALAAAHEAGVIHRDIKPENIMLRSDGFVKVVDFGLARRLPSLLTDDEHRSDTKPGVMLGTVAYMSPEQARGAAAESASDVFSLGVVLYQLLTGRHPFEAGSSIGMLTAITTRQPLSPSRLNPALPRHIDGTVEAMLHKDPRLRPTAAAVQAAMFHGSGDRNKNVAVTSRIRPIVHREAELDVLRSALVDAEAGFGSMLCIAGEPGNGKSTLVEDFLSQLTISGSKYIVGRGQCSERLADTEAYLPVIDALENLIRGDTTGNVARLMQLLAPTWHALVAPATAESLSTPASAIRAPSQQAVLREFCALFDEASRRSPVVLFIDDVHWADNSTVDLLAHLGRQGRRQRLLIIVTVRPTELLLQPHPFHWVKLELQGKGALTELRLGFLRRDEVEKYLALVFPEHQLPGDFANDILIKTEGSPLFVADLLAYLRERGVIARVGGRWSLAQQLPDLQKEIPESVRSMIQRKLAQLSAADRRLLAAAAVQGHEFDSAVVAGALDLDPADVEERLQELARVHNLVRLLHEREFSDRTLTQRYAFVHVLYQQDLYNDLSPSRRASLAASLAQALERLVGDEHSAAAELACLYEVGRDYRAAVRHFRQATENAARVFAHHEAIALAERGLHLLEALPESERTELEIGLLTTLGLQLQITKGYAAPAAERAYTRARELCHQSPDAALEFPVLWGLWLCHKVRSQLIAAQEIAGELFVLARRLNDPALALQAHQSLGMTALCRGEPSAALRNVEQVMAIYDPNRHREHSATFGQDPGVIGKAFGAVALWLLGYPDTAKEQSQQAIELSTGKSPTSEAVALYFAAMVEQLCGDGPRTLTFAERARAIAAEHGLSFWMAGGAVLGGWALAAEGNQLEGLTRLRQGVSDWRTTGSVTYETYFLGLLAERLLEVRRFDEALAVLEESLALVERTDERFYEPELYRLRGAVLLARANGEGPAGLAGAGESFRHAHSLAQKRIMRSLELRAALSLAELGMRTGNADDGLLQLSKAYNLFSEGFETADLKRARFMLLGERP